jgi:hypothetical protein
MRIDELKIHNIVEYGGRICIVRAVYAQFAEDTPYVDLMVPTAIPRPRYITQTTPITEIHAVPLTPSVLFQLGFRESRDSAPGIGTYMYYEHTRWSIALTNVLASRNRYGVEGVELFATDKAHTLQNMVSLLIGESLQIV